MTEKSEDELSAELAEHYEQATATPPYVMFMAAKAGIEKALACGWKATKIWEMLYEKDRMRCSYSTFSRYVKDYIRNPASNKEPGKEDASKQKDPKQQDIPPGATVAPNGRVLPGWPKPGERHSSLPKLDPATYRGELPGFGKKTNLEDFHKF